MTTAAFLLNLDRDGDRLAWMNQQLHGRGISFERLAGILGHAADGADLPAGVRAQLAASPLRPGEVGCWASHLVAAHRILQRDLPYALVMEDDLEIGAAVQPLLARLDHLPTGWGLLRLSGVIKSEIVAIGPLLPGAELVKFSRIPLGLGAYVLSRQGAGEVLAARNIGVEAIDRSWKAWWDIGAGLVTYGISPPPVRQDVFARSSIEAAGGRALDGQMDRTPRPAYLGGRMRGLAANVHFLGAGPWLQCALRNATRTQSVRRRR